MKKLDNLLEKNPLFFVLFLTILMVLFKMFLNIIQHHSAFDDMGAVFLIIGFYFVSWVIAKLFHSIYFRFFICFIVTFTYLSVEMFFDGSYVDYTSFIVTGGVAIFIAVMMLLLMHVVDVKKL